jgi:hypothetical protein
MRVAGKLGRIPNQPEFLARLPYGGPHLDAIIAANPAIPDADWGREVADDAWGDLGNMDRGDCTIAGAGHLITVWKALNPPASAFMSTPEALTNYTKVCPGFDPATGANDNGAVMTDVLSIWMTDGLACGGAIERISGYWKIDQKNHQHVATAVWAFGGVYVGGVLTTDDMTNFNENYAWVKPGGTQEGGHCWDIIAANAQGLRGVTWGDGRQGIGWDWWDASIEECYFVLSPRWLAAGKAPQGFDLDQMLAEASALKA